MDVPIQIEEPSHESRHPPLKQFADLEQIYHMAPVGMAFVDRNLRYVRINEWLAAINGQPAADHIGRSLVEMVPSIGAAIEPLYRRVIETGKPILNMEIHGAMPATLEERDWLVNYYPVKSPDETVLGVGVVVLDITDRKQAEEALRLQSERLQLLSEIDRAILAAKSSTEIADVVLKKIRRLIPARRASIILIDYDRNETVGFALDVDGDSNLTAGRRYPLSQEALPLFSSNQIELYDDLRELTNPPTAIAQLREEGIRTLLSAPLLVQGQPQGRLHLSSNLPHAFTPAHLEIAGQVANQLAIALQQNQLYEQSLLHAVELEQRVAERTAQLEAANKELEAFAYSVSHDLRAPLRAIDGFTRILMEDYASSLDAEGWRVCTVVRDETQRMGQLIDNLLAFSRLSRTQMQVAPIDMQALAQAVFHELTAPTDQARIDFRMTSLPPALGDLTLVRQVWVNLLANALKFSSRRDRAVIEVDYREAAGENTYLVRDNGAGFDMRYSDKLFGVFQRLHSEREFEGTGVGLAIVQRAVHRHGGRVWAEGEPDNGATLYFTLPGKRMSG
jgi:PAS domain S-box-containing protein